MTAIYCRVSTQEQAEHGYSIDEQQDRLTKYCEAMGWEIYAPYVDAGFSGASTDRPALNKLIKDISAGRIRKVVVYKLDRLSRSQKDTLYLIEDVFLKNGVDFVSMSENFDTSTPFGRAMIGILSVFAQLEREQIKERMIMGRFARAKQGKFHGNSTIPVGYDYADGKLTVNEYEAMQIREIFSLYADGYSTKQIERILNEKGYSHKHGKWNYKTIRNHLKRSLYIGEVHFSGQAFDGLHEPIIDKETFCKVQARLNSTAGTRTPKSSSYLGGIIYCAQCGGKYYKVTNRTSYNGNPYVYEHYMCRNRRELGTCTNRNWKMKELDGIVLNEVGKLALDPKAFACSGSPDGRPNVLKNEVVKIEKQIEKLLELYSVGGVPKDILQTKIAELNVDRRKLEEAADANAPTEIGMAEAVKMAESLKEILSNGEIEDVRLIVNTLIKRIDVDGEDITIHWNISGF